MKESHRRIIIMVGVGFVLFLLIYWFMFTGQQLLTASRPIFIGLVIAYPLNIMIRFFERIDILYRRRIIRSERVHTILCTALAVIVLLGCVAFIAGYMGPQLTASAITLLDRVPGGIRYLLNQPFLTQLLPEDTLATLHSFDWNNWINHLVSLVSSDQLFRSMTTTATSALSAFSSIMFGILFSVYFLSGRKTVLKTGERMVRAFVPGPRQERVFHSASLLNECFHNFIVCQALQALIIGISATLLMNVFGFPYASMIGTLNGFCALVPVIGGYAGAVLGTLMILTDNPGMALFFLIFIVILQNVIGALIFPKIVGSSLGMPSCWTLTAVLIGSGLGGITGILIGVPATAFVYRTVKETLEARERAMAAAEKAKAEETEDAGPGTGGTA